MTRSLSPQAHAKAYRILYLEDRPEDMELLQAHLEDRGLRADLLRVENREAFEKGLEDPDLDLVLSDYSLPTFDGLSALDLSQARRPDLPFLLVSGTVGEDVAVESLKRGATDYFLKHRLDRLVPGIHRALAEAQAKRDREAARETLRRQTEAFRALAENIPDTLVRFDHERRITYMNSRLLKASRLPPEHLLGRSAEELGLDPVFIRKLNEALSHVFRGEGVTTITFQGPFDMSRYFEARLAPEFDAQDRVQSAVCVIRDITAAKAAEEALHASETRYRTLVETLEEGIILRDADGNIVTTNPRAEELLGLSAAQMLGRGILNPSLEVIHEDGSPWPPEEQPDAVALRTGQPQRNVVMGVRRADAHLVWVLVNCRPLFDASDEQILGVVVSFSDVTDQRTSMEAMLHASEDRRELLEATAIARAVPWSEQPDHGCRIGESAEPLLGLNPGDPDLSVTSLMDLLVPDDRPLFLAAQAAARDGTPTTFDARTLKHDQELWTRWTVACDGGLLRGVVQDISEQHQLQDQLLQSQKLEVFGSLVGGLAHDFNNLLMGVLGQGQLLELDDLTGAQRRKVETILQAALRGRTLVGQLMNFGRRHVNVRERGPLNAVLQEVVALLGHALPRGITLTLELDPQLPDVLMDPNQIHQVVMNLAINARDALGDTGHLTLRSGRATLRDVDVQGSAAAPGDYAFLEVADDGPGIPPEHLGRIFEPFFTTKEAGKGTGLGLAVVRRVVEGHRGLLRCDSALGRGTTFRILLPLRTAPQGRGVGILDDPGRGRAELQAFLEATGLPVLASEHWRPLHACAVVIVHAEALDDGLHQAAELLAQAPDTVLFIATGRPDPDRMARLPIPPAAVLRYPYEPESVLRAIQAVLA